MAGRERKTLVCMEGEAGRRMKEVEVMKKQEGREQHWYVGAGREGRGGGRRREEGI